VNAPQLARKELAAPKWQGEHVAMGTNVDCYQRAEGRYQLMRGIIAALRDAANPFSILTKGTLILRDLDLLTEAAQVTDVGLNVSAGFIDKELWRTLEPGTPSPERRLDACAALTDAGLSCGVLMGPIVPFLSDSPEQLDAAVRRIAASGAVHVTPIVLHLRPGTREWFLGWLNEHHPELVRRYLRFYGRGAYAPKAYRRPRPGQPRPLNRSRYSSACSDAGSRRADSAHSRPAGGGPRRAHQAHGPDLVAAGRAQRGRVDVDADRGGQRDVGQVVYLPPSHAPGRALGDAPDLRAYPVQDRDTLLQLAAGHHQHPRRPGVVVPAGLLSRQPRLQPQIVVRRVVQALVPAAGRVHAHQLLPRPGTPGDGAGDLLHPRSAQRLNERPDDRPSERHRVGGARVFGGWVRITAHQDPVSNVKL
jgi:DNA repair photolyase